MGGRRVSLIAAGAMVLLLWCELAICAEEPSLRDHFGGEPPDAMIRQLQSDGRPAADHPDFSISRTCRWMPELGVLVIEHTLRNDGKGERSSQGVCLADWAFRLSAGPDEGRYKALTPVAGDKWFGSAYWTGPDWTRVGKDWQHPGEATPSVRRFTAPRDGRVTVSGRVRKADVGGDGVRALICHQAQTVWQAEIGGGDRDGVEPNITLEIRKGDAIRFVIHKRGAIAFDTTYWDPVVTYADGKDACQASKEFATSDRDRGIWSYEMMADPKGDKGRPKLCSFDADFAPRELLLLPGRPVVLTDSADMPFAVVTDQDDRTGVSLAFTASGPWRMSGTMTDEGMLRVKLTVGDAAKPAATLKPGETVRLPAIILGTYRGDSAAGLANFQQVLLANVQNEDINAVRRQIITALQRAAAPLDDELRPDLSGAADWKLPDQDLWAMIVAEWSREDAVTETAESYAAATARNVEKGRRLMADLRAGRPGFLAAEAEQFERLAALSQRTGLDLAQQRAVYYRLRWLKRRIALANPLMNFGKLLFCKRVPTSYSHLVMQYFGWRARPGGGLFVLEDPGYSLRCRDLVDGKLNHGSVLEPNLSYDGKRIVFSFVNCGGRNPVQKEQDDPHDRDFYHLYEVNADGTGLRQLTEGPYDDLMPAHLPDGGIVFSSTRRRGYARCFGAQFGPRWHVYALHRCDADGGNVRTLSFHDTNEWFPAVDHSGRIIYARWDYIDRDAVTHQNLWSTRPDGTNPAVVWGNATPKPHCAFQVKPIPGSHKIMFVGSAHHSITAGTLCIADPTVNCDGFEAITRLTPEIPFPEAESRAIREYYTSPWPLSENYYLVGYSPVPLAWEPHPNAPNAVGIYLLDRFGNRELLYRDTAIGSENPIPMTPRPAPPVLASNLPKDAPPTGEMVLIDVYQGLDGVPRGSVRELRVVQVFPKLTVVANDPPMGVALEENGRAILGTVPVEADGSAHFAAPAGKPLLFQALDKDGFAIQTMRTDTYLQAGERISCVGCHENRMSAPVRASPGAAARPPSKIDPGPLGGRPFSYVEVVQPVLDKHCVACHSPQSQSPARKLDLTGARAGWWTQSYVTLTRDAKRVPRYVMRNQIQVTPVGGLYGALGSNLMKMLRDGHNDVKLSDDEIRRLAAWIDLNAIFYGSPDPKDVPKMLKGEPVDMPKIQ